VAQFLLIDRRRLPELGAIQVVVTDEAIVVDAAEQDPVVEPHPIKELLEIERVIRRDRRGNERFQELGGRRVALLELAAAPGVRPRRQKAGAAPQLDEGPDRMLTLGIHRSVDERLGKGVDRGLSPTTVLLVIGHETLVSLLRVQRGCDVVLGRADLGLDELVDALTEQSLDGIPTRSDGCPARVSDGLHRPVEHVEQDRRPWGAGLRLRPASAHVHVDHEAPEQHEAP
jgi:hypothetical protein